MRKLLISTCFVFAFGWLGCTPSELEMIQLSLSITEKVHTLHDLLSADSLRKDKIPPNADKILMIEGDSITAALSLFEMEDIILLDISVYNGTATSYSFDPDEFVLMDASRMFFRRLEPHDAANIFASRVKDIPQYRPKYQYNVRTSTTGYVDLYGNYSESSTTTIKKEEDPYNVAGYSIGAAIAASRNKKYLDMASAIYAKGFVKGAAIPSTTVGNGEIFWLKRSNYQAPMRLRVSSSGLEFEFFLPPQKL